MDTPSKAQHNLEALERQIEQLQALAGDNQEAVKRLQELHSKIESLRGQLSNGMSAWQRTELARHNQRPYTLDYVEHLFTDFTEVHGDRVFGDDPAIICGMARFRSQEVMLIGHQKARDTKQKLYRNFGMPNPEGYRKALRVMQMAEKFSRPVLTFVDTPGAYPGLGAEERGQAEAIARNLREMARLRVPIITTITGEGGSGGALAIAVADRVLMMENSVYSVISPEGCASIMWRDPAKKEVAAQALKITPRDLKEMSLIDDIVPEPDGGAHLDHPAAATMLGDSIERHLNELKSKPISELVAARYEKFRRMGQFFTE
jgi:acetyl-CoA carboxylase carboxyl transferase subunit alpha